MQNEIWTDIHGYEGRYQVSNFGRVKSLPRTFKAKRGGQRVVAGKILATNPNKKGYQVFSIVKDGKRNTLNVHSLVAQYFVDGRKPGLQVNHKDGDKSNNYFKNLEWVTQSENMRHSIDVLGKSFANGENHGRSKLTQSDVNDIKEMLSGGCKLRLVAEKFGVSIGAISLIKNGKNWKSHVQ